MAIKGGDPILEKQNWSTWFFGLCAFLFLCYGAAIYQELVSRRTYIHYQSGFREFERKYIDKEYEAFKAKEAPKLEAARALEAKYKESAPKLKSKEYKDLQAKQFDQYLRFGFVKAERSKVKSNQDAQFYNWKHAQHSGDEAKTKREEDEYWEIDVLLLGSKSTTEPEHKEA